MKPIRVKRSYKFGSLWITCYLVMNDIDLNTKSRDHFNDEETRFDHSMSSDSIEHFKIRRIMYKECGWLRNNYRKELRRLFRNELEQKKDDRLCPYIWMDRWVYVCVKVLIILTRYHFWTSVFLLYSIFIVFLVPNHKIETL